MKKIKNFVAIIAYVLMLSLISPSAVPVIGTVESVSAAVQISSTSATIIKGQSKQLKIKGTTKQATWSTSNKSVAAVTQKGKVTGKKDGKAVITAKIGSKKYTCSIKVVTASITRKSVTIESGRYIKLSIKNANASVAWSSSNKSVASVNKSGVVTAHKAGTCTIYGKMNNVVYKCSVTVKAKQQQMVWVPASGKKYHSIPNCGNMNPNTAKKISLSEAIKKNYQPCSKCM